MKLNKTLILFPFFCFLQYGCKKDCSSNSNCNLEPDPGVCEAYFPKYYFDQEAQTCKEFIWGGCEGTVPFETLEDCEACECN